MFKKLLVTSAILAASSSVAFAGGYKGENYKGEAPCATCQYLAGPYLGLSIGSRINWQERPTLYHQYYTDPVAGSYYYNNYYQGYNVFTGISGIASIGYGMMVNPMFYIAGEFFADDTARTSNNHGTKNVRSTWDYGFDVIPGVLVGDCVLAYFRAGVIETQFQGHHSNSRTGWRVGLGAETNIYQNWDARMEFVYNQWSNNNNNHHHHRATTDILPLVYYHGHANRYIRGEQFNLGVVYKFL